MVSRALLDEMTFGAVARRERPVSSHIPYTRHVDDHTIKTANGLLVSTLKLEGYCFETADMSEINARMMARNDLVRMLGNSRFALYQHIIRREVEPGIPSSFDNPFCAELDERYAQALGKRRMFVNDIYLSVIRRPLQGQAGTFETLMQKLMGKRNEAGERTEEAEALSELSDVVTAIRENLGAYGARSLSVREQNGVWHSEPL